MAQPTEHHRGGTSGGAGPARRLILLGSTGSIGTQTIEVVEHLNALHARGEWPERYEIVALAAGRNAALLAEQARRLGVRHVALCDGDAAALPRDADVRRGPGGPEQLVHEVPADLVLAAMVGAAGLPATLAAVERGIDVALANKETLVAAGELVVPAACASGAKLLPVDSEHSAIWQCLQGADAARICPPCEPPSHISRVVLTASGGPFRTKSAEQVYHATPAEALNHPTWSMGPKVTIDSASLTNKALEVIEARWLFGLPAERIGVVVHPQSIVHSFVEFDDGNVIAQLGPPNMRLPIQYAVTFPLRPAGCAQKLDLAALGRLDFCPPDLGRFPALGLGFRVVREGGTSGAVFNAANEAAVEAFLAGAVPFGRIPELARGAMDAIGASPVRSLADVNEADAQARRFVGAQLGAGAPASRIRG